MPATTAAPKPRSQQLPSASRAARTTCALVPLATELRNAGHAEERTVSIEYMLAAYEHDLGPIDSNKLHETSATADSFPVILGQLPRGIQLHELRAIIYFVEGIVIVAGREVLHKQTREPTGARVVDVADKTEADRLVALQHCWIFNPDRTVTIVDTAAHAELKRWCKAQYEHRRTHGIEFPAGYTQQPMSAEYANKRAVDQKRQQRRHVAALPLCGLWADPNTWVPTTKLAAGEMPFTLLPPSATFG